MKQIQLIENPKGVFSCEVEITTAEWKDILADSSLAKGSYKEALLAFYSAPNHRSTCRAFGENADSYRSSVTLFCKAVAKRLNRFEINDADGNVCFWPIVCNPGTKLSDGFEWTLRPELVEAMEQVLVCNYWLVGHAFGSNDSQLVRFLNDGIWEGGFDLNKPDDQKQISLLKTMKEGDVLLLKSTATKGTNHNIPFTRIKVIGTITGAYEEEQVGDGVRFRFPVEYKKIQERDFDGPHFGSFRKTIHKLDLSKEPEIKAFLDEVLNGKVVQTTSKYQHYVDLLKANHNIVLTGAPGTGKTFMAHEIAKEMGCGAEEIAFVQFHPSYDYTDFVEGLRPKDNGGGQIGFERTDGVFKAFCAKALDNEIQSAKSREQQEMELTLNEKLNRFLNEAVDSQQSFELVNGGSFRITEINDNAVYVYNDTNEKVKEIKVSLSHISDLLNNNVPLNSVGDLRDYYKKAYRTQQDSYEFVITNKVREMPDKVVVPSEKIVPRKNYVFIIDEINRGEASKIFGELFFAIDPGYRGDKSRKVKTQYQNMLLDGETFADGFYVPSNVYIIGTMNDIDRSVESMDFAMRRRFTWLEVDPADTEDMLNDLQEPLALEAKQRMRSLNRQICDTEGLGKAFQIGGAYFLKLKNNKGDFRSLWKMNIEPLLREYLRGARNVEEAMAAFEKAYLNAGEADTAAGDEDDTE